MPDVKCVLIHDNFQNFKSYNIPKAQLVIADIPYNIGADFYASRPDWYVDGDNKNGESSKARKAAFNTDFTFNIAEYFHFCNRLLKKEPGTGEKDAPCMIVFCAFQQIPKVIMEAEKYGFKNYIPLVFCKNYSPQVLICGCFASTSRQASCNYGIGKDGKISLCVEEKNRSWCSSSNANDQRAITIECASDKSEPYAMNSAVYASLIKLCTDICQRNGKRKLLWLGDKNKTLNYAPASDEMVLTVHRWYHNFVTAPCGRRRNDC